MEVSRPDCQKAALTTFELVLNLFYSFKEGVQWFINGLFQKQTQFSNASEGVQHFPEGPTFCRGGGGVQMLISIETHITCDFPGRVRTPYSPSGSTHDAQ